jgi:cytochrome b6-f complex iron-sulfur subunit
MNVTPTSAENLLMKQNGFTPDQPESIRFSRREIIISLGGMSLLAALISLTRQMVRFMMPPINRVQAAVIIGGSPVDFAPGVLTPLVDAPVFIGRDAQGLFALSAICTHLGCTLNQTDEGFVCPCHQSRFSSDGARLSGPASRALPYLALSLNADGLIEINPDQAADSTFRLKV